MKKSYQEEQNCGETTLNILSVTRKTILQV